MCFTDPSDTATKCLSLACALNTSSIGVSILPCLFLSGVDVTNLMRSMIHTIWPATICLNDSGGPPCNVYISFVCQLYFFFCAFLDYLFCILVGLVYIEFSSIVMV